MTVSSSNAKVLTFKLGARRYGLAADLVEEVSRIPRISRVPHAPPALLGLANLRGSVVPVLSLAELLNCDVGTATRIIIVDAGEPVGLAVTEVSEMVEARDAGSVQEIDVADLVARSLPAATGRRKGTGSFTAAEDDQVVEDKVAFITFSVAAQDFALPISVIEEVMARPKDVSIVPHAEDVVVGSAAVRGAVLPLLSLWALLALPGTSSGAGSHVVVVRIGTHRVGLVVDGMRSILRVAETDIDPVPNVLSRGNAEARIQAICRLDDGKRLVSVLAADQLLRDDITVRLLEGSAEGREIMAQDQDEAAGEQFLLFRIGDEEFGLPIDTVEEVVPLPSKLSRLPRAPAFVRGIINLRGDVIPVIDQALRFGSAAGADRKRRIVVVHVEELRVGFIVDDISEVARLDPAALRDAPDLGGDDTRVFERVANLADQQRIVLIVSPRELLSRAERDLLRSLGKKGAAKKS